jgi:hypothetical protein
MFNQVTLIGHLGADPEVRNTTNGGRVVNLSVATSRPRFSDGKVVSQRTSAMLSRKPSGTASSPSTAKAKAAEKRGGAGF